MGESHGETDNTEAGRVLTQALSPNKGDGADSRMSGGTSGDEVNEVGGESWTGEPCGEVLMKLSQGVEQDT